MSPLPGDRYHCVISYGMLVPVVVRLVCELLYLVYFTLQAKRLAGWEEHLQNDQAMRRLRDLIKTGTIYPGRLSLNNSMKNTHGVNGIRGCYC